MLPFSFHEGSVWVGLGGGPTTAKHSSLATYLPACLRTYLPTYLPTWLPGYLATELAS